LKICIHGVVRNFKLNVSKINKIKLDENWKIATIERLYFFILGKF